MFDLYEEFVTRKEFNELRQSMLEQKKEQGNSPAPSKKYIRKKELKKQLGISDSTVRRLVLNGYIEQFEFAGILYYDWEKICQQFKKCRGGKNQ